MLGHRVRLTCVYRIGVETFIWRFFPEDLNDALKRLGLLASDKEVPAFTWFDAAKVARRMRNTVAKLEAEVMQHAKRV